MAAKNSSHEQILKIKGEHLERDTEAFKRLVERGVAKDFTFVFVICITGVSKLGKTFLMNLFSTYLTFYSKHGSDKGWVDAENTKVTGGDFASGDDHVTTGMWMYMHPTLIHNTAIILMDCEGADDTGTGTTTADNALMFLALHMADIHILNVNRMLANAELSRIHTCHTRSNVASAKLKFRRQIFLIRNRPDADRPKQLDEIIKETKSDETRKLATAIKNAFQQVDVESLPYPGEGVDGKSNRNNVTLADISKRFREDARKFFQELLRELPLRRVSTLRDFKQKFEKLSEWSVSHIASSEELYELSCLLSFFEDLRSEYSAGAFEILKQIGSLEDTQVMEKLMTLHWSITEKFDHHELIMELTEGSANGKKARAFRNQLNEEHQRVLSGLPDLFRQRNDTGATGWELHVVLFLAQVATGLYSSAAFLSILPLALVYLLIRFMPSYFS